MYITFVEKLTDELLKGNFAASKDILQKFIEEGTRKNSYEVYDFLTKAMRRVGWLWEENIITVADEHIASIVCKFLVQSYHLENVSLNNTSLNRRAMFYSIEGEQHEIGINIIANLFKEAGWETLMLGGDVPLKHVKDQAESWQPDVIAISISMSYHLPHLIRHLEVLEKLHRKPKLIVGGRLTQQYDLSQYSTSSTTIIKHLYELKKWIQKEQQMKGICP